eukprot:TRINITY_DN10529_c0_g1_i2.p1 TRINITY_DN10529_c0_g1~~TRINITY_DN10529_c0_g1_i2.p1  ORF type:complete len:484 (+),score=141.98 TRINITY_DN10529_c0_g1_i2:102-1553(+)
MASTARAKPFFSTNVQKKVWERYQATGVSTGMMSRGKQGMFHKRLPDQKWIVQDKQVHVHIPHLKNTPSWGGSMITSQWLPENAKKKNMRPKYELFNTTEKDGLALRQSKRLAQVSLPVDKSMPDDIRISRELNESLHSLEHTPLLHQQWDPERKVLPEFDTRDSAGRPLPAEVLPDFPRFYDREMFAELDNWQRETNEARANPNTEMYIYYHFWAHDDEWVYKRRVDVWDYVKSQAGEYLREKLASVQRQLYGEERVYPALNTSVLLRHHPLRRVSSSDGLAELQLFVNCKPSNPRHPPVDTELRYRVKSEDAWHRASLTGEGTALLKFRVPEAILDTDVVTVEVGDASVTIPCSQVTQSAQRRLHPPSDLARSLPGWSEEEVEALYRQELMRFEEELYNTLHNLDAITTPTPILYASQTEIMNMASGERLLWRASRKSYDWWFHHQSFCLYVPHSSLPAQLATSRTPVCCFGNFFRSGFGM